MGNRITDSDILKAFDASGGNISDTAKALNCSRVVLYKRVQKSETLKQALKDAREELLDMAETALKKNVNQGKEQSVFFALRYLGRNRGYVEKSSIDMHIDNDVDTLTAMRTALGLPPLIQQGVSNAEPNPSN